jgi:hypothetical protein
MGSGSAPLQADTPGYSLSTNLTPRPRPRLIIRLHHHAPGASERSSSIAARPSGYAVTSAPYIPPNEMWLPPDPAPCRTTAPRAGRLRHVRRAIFSPLGMMICAASGLGLSLGLLLASVRL